MLTFQEHGSDFKEACRASEVANRGSTSCATGVDVLRPIARSLRDGSANVSYVQAHLPTKEVEWTLICAATTCMNITLQAMTPINELPRSMLKV